MSTGKWKKHRKQQPPVSLICSLCSSRFTKPAYYYKFRIKNNPKTKFFCTKNCHTNSMKKDPKKKTRSKTALLRSLQTVVNLYCRVRDCYGDEGAACISCSKWFPFGRGDGGHFIAQGSSSALRFDERNINFQCHRCNRFLHGNSHNYYIGMVRKYGQEVVDELMEKQHESKKWTEEEIKELRAYYQGKTNNLRAGRKEPSIGVSVLDVFSNNTTN